MTAETWKYVENQFDSVTKERFSLMDEILDDHVPRLAAAAVANAVFAPLLTATELLRDQWRTAFFAAGATTAQVRLASENLRLAFEGLTAKPNPDTSSLVEQWDITVRSQVAYQGPIYNYLLPLGREGFTGGSYEDRLEYLAGFAARLAEQTNKPVLVTLSNTVGTYHYTTVQLREAQSYEEQQAEVARDALLPLRLAVAQQLYGTTGFAMNLWKANSVQVASLFDLSLFREPATEKPAAPADTLWVPSTRTLQTSAMPAEATRLNGYRLAPGGAPELIAPGERDALAVVVPQTILFQSGVMYELWLTGVNGAGEGEPGPVQVWTAP